MFKKIVLILWGLSIGFAIAYEQQLTPQQIMQVRQQVEEQRKKFYNEKHPIVAAALLVQQLSNEEMEKIFGWKKEEAEGKRNSGALFLKSPYDLMKKMEPAFKGDLFHINIEEMEESKISKEIENNLVDTFKDPDRIEIANNPEAGRQLIAAIKEALSEDINNFKGETRVIVDLMEIIAKLQERKEVKMLHQKKKAIIYQEALPQLLKLCADVEKKQNKNGYLVHKCDTIQELNNKYISKNLNNNNKLQQKTEKQNNRSELLKEYAKNNESLS